MSAAIVGVRPRTTRLQLKVGGAALPPRPARVQLPLSPGHRRRKLDAAYLERFFARTQRTLATGMLSSSEREAVRLPSKGRLKPAVAQALGLVMNPDARPGDLEATHWIPAAPFGRIMQSPFLPKPQSGNAAWPKLVKPLISPLSFRRLWHTARRQGLDHLLPTGPRHLVESYEAAEERRREGISDAELLGLAAAEPSDRMTLWHAAPDTREAAMGAFALALPRYGHLTSTTRLFPYSRVRLLKKQQRARAIVDAMASMPRKVQSYREGVRQTKIASRRGTPL